MGLTIICEKNLNGGYNVYIGIVYLQTLNIRDDDSITHGHIISSFRSENKEEMCEKIRNKRFVEYVRERNIENCRKLREERGCKGLFGQPLVFKYGGYGD